jgi:hypothetical protein
MTTQPGEHSLLPSMAAPVLPPLLDGRPAGGGLLNVPPEQRTTEQSPSQALPPVYEPVPVQVRDPETTPLPAVPAPQNQPGVK